MTANFVVSCRLVWNPLEKTPRSNAPELKRVFCCIRERSVTKFTLGHALRENNSTKRITSLLSSERKGKIR